MPTVVDVDVVTGETYYIAVDGVGGAVATAFSVSVADITVNDTDLPAGALGMLDFKTGTYKWGTTLYSAADVIDHPEFVVPGIGLYIDDYFGANQAVRIRDDTPFFDHIQSNEFSVTFEVASTYYIGFLWATKSAPTPPFSIVDFEVEPNFPGSSPFIYFEVMGGQGGSAQFFSGTAYRAGPDRAMYACSASLANNAVNMCWDTGPNAGTVFSDAGSPQAMATMNLGLWLGGDGSSYENQLFARVVFYPYAGAGSLASYMQDPVMEFPANDLIADAQVVALNEQIETQNFTASYEEGEPDIGGTREATNSLWYKFTAPTTRNYKITTTGYLSDNINLNFAVFTADSLPVVVTDLTLIAANTTAPKDTKTWAATSGTDYYLAFDGWGARGEINFIVEEA